MDLADPIVRQAVALARLAHLAAVADRKVDSRLCQDLFAGGLAKCRRRWVSQAVRSASAVRCWALGLVHHWEKSEVWFREEPYE